MSRGPPLRHSRVSKWQIVLPRRASTFAILVLGCSLTAAIGLQVLKGGSVGRTSDTNQRAGGGTATLDTQHAIGLFSDSHHIARLEAKPTTHIDWEHKSAACVKSACPTFAH
jgi:hypothetical protein